MIYSTNRTASLGEMTVDVNESYFGAGMLNFMQENAQDELALFEEAIKSDIDECLIGESVTELESLNEGFIQSAANKIKEMMRKFIEWLKAVTRSAIAKLSQLLVRDNAKFVKIAKKRIATMPDSDKFKYSGKGIVSNSEFSPENIKAVVSNNKGIKDDDSLYIKAKNAKSDPELESIKNEIESILKESKEDAANLRKNFEDKAVKDYDVQGKEAINVVKDHIKILDGLSKKTIGDLRKKMKDMESTANKISREADKKAREYDKDNELEKKKLSVMASAASAYKEVCQSFVSDMLYIIKQESKIARAVVSKAMGASPKNEGTEYSEELIDAMIEAANYEYDEALEEMSEGKDCSDCEDDDIEDEE